MAYIISLIIGGFVFIVAFNFWPEGEIVNLKKRFSNQPSPKQTLTQLSNTVVEAIVKWVSGINWGWLVKQREIIKKQLDMAGNPQDMTPDSYLAITLICAAGFLMMELMFLKKTNLMVMFISLAIGGFLPKLYLSDLTKKRHRLIVRTLPDILDLITLSMEAGVDFTASISKVISKTEKSPLIEEFVIMQRGMRLGQSRMASMKDMIARVQEPNLSTVITALVQAEKLGSSLGPVLRVQSEQMRVKRFQLAEKMAQQAPIKMLFPLIFCILPSIFLMLFGPIVLQYLGGAFK
ncbi:MAG: type II secretion system F family protein [Elusimicrobia bacterium]|nr:type II secretion system F family protein [Elusimicrobiota bacterium]